MQDKFEDGQLGFEGFVYHDDPEEAAVDWVSVGIYDNVGSALLEIQQTIGYHWNGGGSLHRGRVEVDPFTGDPRMPDVEATCYVGPSGEPDPIEWQGLTATPCEDCGRSEAIHLDEDAAPDSRDGLGCAYTDGSRQYEATFA